MRASTKRSGDRPSEGGVSVATRIAEIAAWLTRIVPAPSSSAASEASDDQPDDQRACPEGEYQGEVGDGDPHGDAEDEPGAALCAARAPPRAR